MNKLPEVGRAAATALLCLSLLATGCKTSTSPSPEGSSVTPSAGSPTPVTQVDLTPGKVKAGIGVEGISLGESKAQVNKTLGAPEETDSNEFAPGQDYALYYKKGIELSFTKDKLEVITLHSPDSKWAAYTGATEKGLGVGSAADEIVKALGEPAPDAPRALRYPKLGLWFRLNAERGSSSGARAESLQIMKPE